jgi:hypothetical protein
MSSSNPPASSSTAFTSIVLGRSSNAIELLVPPAPAVHDATDLKARCFDCLADLLVEHAPLYSSAELIAAFGHIPSSSYNAALEAAAVCRLARSAFFSVDNLDALGFRDHDGAPVSQAISADLSQRPTGITYFAFRSTLDPSTIDSRLSIPSYSFEFWLRLPQTLFSNSTAAAGAASPGGVAKVLQFATPTKSTNQTPVITKDDFLKLSDPEKAALATSASTDIVSDYTSDCLSLFTKSQLRTLVLRTAAAAPTVPALSPRMATVLASPTASRSSYFGPLEFIDSQAAFDSTFPKPVPLLVTTSSNGVSIDSLSLSVALNQFLDQCKFYLFVPIFRSDYVGTLARDDSASLHATLQALKKSSCRGPPWLGPDELFAVYNDLTPLLPNNVSLWGLKSSNPIL